MIPVSLMIKGLYSYAEEQFIDFTVPVQARLFGIFGKVGSGKSSILEAMSLALFGKTERLGGKDDKNYNLMNLKSNELLIEFIFRAGDGNAEYMAVFSAKRNKRQFSEVGSPKRAAYKKENSEWVPVSLGEIEEAVGLSYDNFKRVIIIPQGQFKEFLELGGKDRSEMLKEMFNLGKFDMAASARMLEYENNENIAGIDGEIRGIGDVFLDKIAAKKQELEILNKDIGMLKADVAKLKEDEQCQKSLKLLFDSIIAQKQALAQLEEGEPDFAKREKCLLDYQKCRAEFSGIIGNLESTRQNISANEIALNRLESDYAELQKKLAGKISEFGVLKADYDCREQMKAKAKDISTIIELKKLNDMQKKLKTDLAYAEAEMEKAKAELDTFCCEAVSLSEKIDCDEKKMPDIAKLGNISAWFIAKAGIIKNIEAAKNKIAKHEKNLAELNLRKGEILDDIATGAFLKCDVKDMEIAGIIAIIEERQKESGAEIDELQVQIDDICVKTRLADFAQNLQGNQPCPLCGSLEHPSLLKMEGLEPLNARMRLQKKEIMLRIEKLREIAGLLDALNTKIALSEENIKEEKIALDEENACLCRHIQCFKWDGYSSSDESLIKAMMKDAEEIKKGITENKARLKGINTKIDGLRVIVDEKRTKPGLIKQEIAKADAGFDTLSRGLCVVRYEERENDDVKCLSKEADALLAKFENITAEYQKAEKYINDTQRIVCEKEGQICQAKKALELDKIKYGELKNEIDAKLAKSGYKDEGAVLAILNACINTDSEKQQIEEFRDRLNRARGAYESSFEKAKGQAYDSESHARILARILEHDALLEDKGKCAGGLDNEIKKLERDLCRLNALRVQMDRLSLRKTNLEVMKKLFASQGFVDYISTVYLKNICAAANERFYKLTNQQLKLVLAEDNSFNVRDFLNGGRERSVKTLSGGQTFQASLCLAIALTDIIQKLNKSSDNFFFMDEGFGSLDEDTLTQVFNALQSLKKENKIIGVISHVDMLKQQIDMYLNVELDKERGSIVAKSWEG